MFLKGNSDKQVGFLILLLGSLGFIYYTVSSFMIILFPTETTPGKIGHYPYFMPYNLLVKIPAVGLVLFLSIIGTCISLVMIKQAVRDKMSYQSLKST
ncbi:uncharacterized protein VP01_2017g3 [Puccinia sorghi]|uniref:Dolichol phosphate-mannose biosynthesis regulatory protein n=1 Tax=Puccinia sorghi TaxID=27349 RepID=A0A0L6VB88_9BASI|nr:uncharacterized protein VP01_2017g3 [Puccinia sorghi]